MAQPDFDIQTWLALLSTAYSLGNVVYEGVRKIAAGQLNQDELNALELAWDDDVRRSARNAGIPYNPDQSL
jgi:hypothetical protein